MTEVVKQKNKVGRKGKFHDWITEDGLKKLEAWARNGYTDDMIAERMGVALSTFYEYKNRFPELTEALKKGKDVVDDEVENALLKSAMGYDYEEEKKYISEVNGVKTIRREVYKKHVPPSNTAQIFWLKNRRPDIWRDKKETQLSGAVDIKNPFDGISTEDIKKLLNDE